MLVPLSSDPPYYLDLDGSREEGWREEERPFCHQRGSDQRIHHQHSQAYPWSVSIPAVAQGLAFGARNSTRLVAAQVCSVV